MKRKGIILAGGSGSRLYPSTVPISKQLIPIYDKPMIYYPLSTLMLSCIRDILIISTPLDINRFNRLFGDGSDLGINISYAVQEEPKGLADAFIVGEDFIGNNKVSLILGDNLFYGNDLSSTLQRVKNQQEGATIFCNKVKHPERYGVLNLDSSDKPESIIEKPSKPKSNLAVTGLYYYDEKVVDFAKDLKPSKRGELEISSINQLYLDLKMLKVEILGRGFAWLDTGTHENLLLASTFVETIEKRQGLKIACIEEIAYEHNYISKEQLQKLAHPIINNQYGKYLMRQSNRKN